MKNQEIRIHALELAGGILNSDKGRPKFTAKELIEIASEVEGYVKQGIVKPEKCDTCGK